MAEDKEVKKDDRDVKESKKQTKTNTKTTRSRKQDSSKKVQETKSTDAKSKGTEGDNKQVGISKYVSNVDGSVYAISGLPEEFIATLFAWVSRSSKSFKEHLQIALQDQDIKGSLDAFKELDEKAKKFHEKWTVGYGHSSVAEHAVAHVGIENISRLASAELELANTFLSITEYSQRYQKPERGKWYNPFSAILVGQKLDKSSLHERVEDFFNKSFDTFEELIEKVHAHLCEKEGISVEPKARESKAIKSKRNALLKLAFEDARYVLPLSMYTQLGMTANGRAWRDALAVLGNSGHKESQELADNLRTEITKVLPVLLKYATPSQYQKNSKKRMEKTFDLENTNDSIKHEVQLQSVQTEEEAINKIIALLNQQYSNMPYATGVFMSKRYTDQDVKEQVIKDLLFEMEHFDQAPDVFKHIKYDATLLVSEANWHQLLRHNRKTDFTYSKPSPYFGITIPPRIVEAGLEKLVKDIAAESKELYNVLVEEGYEKEAEYVVINAHRRQVYMSLNLWEAYHLINLRTSEDAQWDIRDVCEELFKQLYIVHPLLMSQAKRRLN